MSANGRRTLPHGGDTGQVPVIQGDGTVDWEDQSGGGSSQLQIQDEGSNVTVRDTVNFTGDGVTVTDDAGGARTVVSVQSSSAAEDITFDPAGGIASTDVQAAIEELDAEKAAASHTHAQADVTNLTTDLAAKAPLASPALTGTPTVPTAAGGTNTTQAASTAFVAAAVAALINSAPGALDTLDELAAALGDDANFAATITNALALKADLASPALTGNPTAPTQSQGNNSTRLATTAYVQTEVGLVVPKSLVDAKGDLLVGTANDTVARKAVSGTNGRVLKEDSGQADGLAWGQVGLDGLSDTARPGSRALPTGAIAQTFDRSYAGGETNPLSSGRLQLVWGMVLPAGRTVTSITFVSAQTSFSSNTHRWFGLFDANRVPLRFTNNETSGSVWAGNTALTLNLSSTYTPTVDTPVYVGICVVGGTIGTINGFSQTRLGAASIAPIIAGTSTTGLTDPASCPNPAGALTAVGILPYAYVS